MSARFGSSALLLASVGLTSGRALAAGAPPEVSQLLVDPSNEQHLAVRSNFGLLLSQDAGKTWDFRCKAELGYPGPAEPALAILDGGALVLGVATGIRRSDAAGCAFEPASGIHERVVDVIAVPDVRGAALAVSVSFTDNASRVWRSSDDGRSFQPLGAVLPRLTALSLGVPLGMPSRIYMTGLRWAEAVSGVFAVSDDGGKTFSITPIADSDSGAQPFIAAINPKQPDTVYLRLTGLPGRLRVSTDAGRSFREILSMPGPLQGFAVSGNGEQIFASSIEAGTYRANVGSLAFERVACEGLPCLAATGTALLGCGERGRDGFIVGRSDDGAQSFSRLLDTPCLEPASCVASKAPDARCAAAWTHLTEQLAHEHAECEPAAPVKPVSRACFADAGVSEAKGVQGSHSAALGPNPETRTPGTTQRHACACVLPGAPASGSSAGRNLSACLFALCAFRARFRRERRARAATSMSLDPGAAQIDHRPHQPDDRPKRRAR